MIVTKPQEAQSKSGKKKNYFEKTADFISYLEKFRTFIIAVSLLLSGYWVSDAINKASLISNSIDKLVEPGSKRAIALIALDTGISPPPSKLFGIPIKNCILGIGESCKDPVVDIAEKLYRAEKNNDERLAITEIMQRRNPQKTEKFISLITGTSSSDNTQSQNPRLVYIQYKSNKTKAEELQKALQQQNISAPGIEQVSGINKNDIRYANAADEQIAKNLQVFLETKQGIKVESLIDLSKAGYRVPSGQLEIWLKD